MANHLLKWSVCLKQCYIIYKNKMYIYIIHFDIFAQHFEKN